jgi:single-strand DNA-binding protein
MNFGTFAGRLGEDATLRYTPSGTPVLGFSIAVDGRKKNGDKTTTWVEATIWEERAEKLQEHLTKGTSVVVSGPVHARAYTNKAGDVVAKQCVTVRELTFMGRAQRDEKPGKSVAAVEDTLDDDIPF